VTPQEWAQLTPPQQYQHAADHGSPPVWYPLSAYAAAPAPQVNVAVGQSVVFQGGQHRRRTAHGLHLVWTLLTGGLWGFVWLALVISRR
jgi:hypothetical protein